MMTQLAEKKCSACEGASERLDDEELRSFIAEVHDDWDLVEGAKKIRRTFKFDDFKQALEFVNRVGNLAEEEAHHPDICLTYGKATVEIWTHKVDGLTENDFILAAKIDKI